MIRLQKYLSEREVASRRKCEEIIKEARVKVNGKIVTSLGTKVSDKDEILVDDKPIIKPQKEYYLLSSLDEYLSILDGEQGSSATMTKSSVADSLAQIKSSSVAMSRSGVTNPISKASNTGKAPASPMNGLIVKSGYNIDAEKGIYLVNLGGVSALIGRIDESIFVLKKFDSVVEGPLQVRQDDANVYIVKAGRYKCLVDVSKDSMGTLIEI